MKCSFFTKFFRNILLIKNNYNEQKYKKYGLIKTFI